MCYPIAIGLAMAAVSAISSFSQSETARGQQKYQAQIASNNAVAMNQQADLEVQKGQIEQKKSDLERDKLRKSYEAEAAANRSVIAGRGVEFSGSAADFLAGNANTFSEDILNNRYNKAMAGWEANEKARQTKFQADQYASQASYYKKSAGSLGKSLLTAGMNGAASGLSAYGGMK